MIYPLKSNRIQNVKATYMLPPNKLSDPIEELHDKKMTTTPLLRYTKTNKSDPKRESKLRVTP